jgi:hypothetical protein
MANIVKKICIYKSGNSNHFALFELFFTSETILAMPNHTGNFIRNLQKTHISIGLKTKVSAGHSIIRGQQEEFEDTKEVIRIRISKTNRQHNNQAKKYKRTNNDLQNIQVYIKLTIE